MPDFLRGLPLLAALFSAVPGMAADIPPADATRPAAVQTPAQRAAATARDALGVNVNAGLEATLTSNAEEAPEGRFNSLVTPFVEAVLSRALTSTLTGSAGVYASLSRYGRDPERYDGETLYPFLALYQALRDFTLEAGYSHDYGFAPLLRRRELVERRATLALQREWPLAEAWTVQSFLELARLWEEEAGWWSLSPQAGLLWEVNDSLYITMEAGVSLERQDAGEAVAAAWAAGGLDYALTGKLSLGLTMLAFREQPLETGDGFSMVSATPRLAVTWQF